MAGLLFWISFDTAQGTNLRTDNSMLRLSDLIQEKSRRNQQLDKDLSAVHKQVDRLAGHDAGTNGAGKRLDGLRGRAGTKKVTGPAVSVTLADAPPDAGPRIPGVPDPSPNDLVIHQQDLQAVVNALWRGGAQGIKVMDQRLISTSAVRCVGNTLILQGRVYSPPYTVTAVGDRAALRRSLDKDPSIENYLQYVQAYGLGWKVQERKRVTLPGYSGTVDLHYAAPAER
ncbi:DUF881 domain-containing protein [Wenjunlia tyrosinilytica]|jgi:uncharacterized protein YlxW (UPF0749 family)|nr:DUF881 domain-containing protein [Wenjunlia tyrosinilytica]